MNGHHKRHLFFWFITMSLAISTSVGATTTEGGDNVHISAIHEIDDDFYAFSNKIKIDGTVTGDFLGIGGEVVVKGTIGGSANFLGRYVDHNGSVEGSLRFMGERLTVTGRVGGSIVAAGASIMIRQGSIIEKDVNLAAAEIDLDGTILGNATCASGDATVRVTAQIGGDLDIEGEKIVIAPPAVIRGDLTYRTAAEDQLTIEPGVTVIGTTTWEPPDIAEDEDGNFLPDMAYAIANLLAAFIFGLLVIKLFRPYTEESIKQMQTKPTASFAAGLVAVAGLVMAALVLVFALIGTAIGTVLLSGELAFLGVALLVLSLLATPISSFATVVGAIIMYSGKIVVAMVLGHLVIRPIRSGGSQPSKLALFAGLILLALAGALPFYVGTVIYFITMFVGAGAIVLGIYRCRHAT